MKIKAKLKLKIKVRLITKALIQIISTNNIATGMVHGRRKYAFNSPKYVFIQIVVFPYRFVTFPHAARLPSDSF
jgi:hypothetical protein